MHPSENIDHANPGLSPLDRQTLQELRNQTPTRSDGDAEKMLLEIAPTLDPLAERFLRDTKHATFATINDADLGRWLQAEWCVEPDDGEHARKAQRLDVLWRAAIDVVLALSTTEVIPAQLIELLGRDWWSDDRKVRIERATTKYRHVAGDHSASGWPPEGTLT